MSDGDDAGEGPGPAADAGFRSLLDKLSTTYDFDFREYKEPSLARRIRARMSLLHITDFDAYSRYLGQRADEHVALFNTTLINVTSFFRDPEAWRVTDEYLVKIYGTDVDEEALSRPVDRYFTCDGQLHRLRRELRRWCIFGAHNITQAPPLSHIDLLLCRNVLIYFNSRPGGRGARSSPASRR